MIDPVTKASMPDSTVIASTSQGQETSQIPKKAEQNQTETAAAATLTPAYSVQLSTNAADGNKGESSQQKDSSKQLYTPAVSQNNTTAKKDSTTTSSLITKSTEDTDTTNLAQYTDAELTQLVSSGKITQAEANTELAKRAAEKESTTKSEEKNNPEEVNAL